MTDTQWILIGVFVVVILLIVMFRGSLKLGLEALGIRFSAEATNPPKTTPPNDAPKAAQPQGTTINGGGERSITGVNLQDSVNNTGDNNTVAPPPKPRKP